MTFFCKIVVAPVAIVKIAKAFCNPKIVIAFHFKDTSIIVARLSKNSIPDHASKILTAICEHFVYLTKGLTEMPYEIFVPVFEDVSVPENPSEINSPCGYFDYWGLYFDHGPKHEALIYALNKKKFFEDSIFLFE